MKWDLHSFVARARWMREQQQWSGWPGAFTLAALKIRRAYGRADPPVLKIRPRWVNHPLNVRLGDSSDMDVLEQIFKETQYACVAGVKSPRVIFDLGANVGYASAYFLSRFPAAEVVAVEPDPGNYEICCRNLFPYGPRARVILGAVWSHRRKLVLLRGAYRDGREWTTQVLATDNPDDAATVDAWDIPSLLKLAGHNHIDILKVDIERSDVELFSNGSRQWLPNVRNMCIELHDEDCERAFFGALQDYEFDLSRSGELTVCLNLRPRLNGNSR